MTPIWPVSSALTHLLEPETVIKNELDRFDLGSDAHFDPPYSQAPLIPASMAWSTILLTVVHLGLIAPTIPGTSAPWVPSGALRPGSKPIWLALFASPPGKGILQNVATLLVGNKKYWTRAFASPARWQFKKPEALGTLDSNPSSATY